MSLDVRLYVDVDTGGPELRKVELYWANITHNLGKMATAVGIYHHLWRPSEIGITRAGELIDPLQAGLDKLKANRSFYEAYNAPNGWGTYEHFVPFVEKYLQACMDHPKARIDANI